VVVNGESISQSSLDAQLAAVSSSSGYLCYLNATSLVRSNGQSSLGPVTGATPASYSSGFVTDWLDQMITNTIVRQAAEREGLAPLSQSALSIAEQDLVGAMDATLNQVAGTQAACSGTATSILGAMPVSFVQDQIDAQAYSEALLVHHGGLGLDASSVAEYYAQHTSSFDTYCVSGILVADLATSAEVQAALAAGKSFASVAEEYSVDTSKSNGGSLGCFSPTSPSYSSVVADVSKLAVGQVSSPLPSSSGQIVTLVVTSRTTTPLSSIEDVVRRTILSKDASNASSVATHLVRTASVTLSPRYGEWSTTKALSGVVPPTVPPNGQVLNPTANLPGAG
jgi:hypothetical protein